MLGFLWFLHFISSRSRLLNIFERIHEFFENFCFIFSNERPCLVEKIRNQLVWIRVKRYIVKSMFLLAEELSSVIRPVMVIRKLWEEKVTQPSKSLKRERRHCDPLIRKRLEKDQSRAKDILTPCWQYGHQIYDRTVDKEPKWSWARYRKRTALVTPAEESN